MALFSASGTVSSFISKATGGFSSVSDAVNRGLEICELGGNEDEIKIADISLVWFNRISVNHGVAITDYPTLQKNLENFNTANKKIQINIDFNLSSTFVPTSRKDNLRSFVSNRFTQINQFAPTLTTQASALFNNTLTQFNKIQGYIDTAIATTGSFAEAFGNLNGKNSGMASRFAQKEIDKIIKLQRSRTLISNISIFGITLNASFIIKDFNYNFSDSIGTKATCSLALEQIILATTPKQLSQEATKKLNSSWKKQMEKTKKAQSTGKKLDISFLKKNLG